LIPYDYPAYPNLERTVVALGSLADELLFVGGATIGLYVTELQVREPRATEDVDTVCEATTYIELSRFADRMRSIGFNEDMSSNVICRWTKGDLVVDLMPVDESALGFRNRWYRTALDDPWRITLANGQQIRIPKPALALACKLDAFADRGKGDFFGSKDFEDIVVLVDGRESLANEVAAAHEAVREYVAQAVVDWMRIPDFPSAVSAHLPPDAASQARTLLVLERMRLLSQ